MTLVGYSDRFSARPGNVIKFMISTDAPTYEADVIRLVHGDLNPRGPGFKCQEIASAASGRYPGRLQELRPGSCVVVPAVAALDLWRGFTLTLWMYPTAVTREQAIFHQASFDNRCAVGLFLTADAHLELRLRDAESREVRLRSVPVVPVNRWTFVGSSFNPTHSIVRLHHATQGRPRRFGPVHLDETRVDIKGPASAAGPLCFAAARDNVRDVAACHYNGKLEGPRLTVHALAAPAIAALMAGRPGGADEGVIGAWNFGPAADSALVVDESQNRLHARAVNAPTRAATGHLWDGTCLDFKAAPEHYAAIHFHDDDLSDAGWQSDIALAVPQALQSGVYALRLRTASEDDYIPFAVRAGRDTPNRLLLLLPTFSYLAYANEHIVLGPGRRPQLTLESAVRHATPYEARHFSYITDNKLLSLYDLHTDGSGTCYASRLRPLVNMRPRYNKPGLDFQAPHQLNADLYLVDWLEAMGFGYDVATDDDLHHEGAALLRPYKAVMTGTHPEYVSRQILEALDAYLHDGGRLMYMGGNGFYWVTSVDPNAAHIIEVRRAESGERAWQAAPGEYYHATTGEPGGLWRFRGWAPQSLVGIGFTAQGADRATPYRRVADATDPEVGFVFEGVTDELLGDFGLHLGGAAGWELDRMDSALGSSPLTRTLATSIGHSDRYQHAIEESRRMSDQEGGTRQPLVRADMVYVPYPNGGAVFATGSISYAGCLSDNQYDNNISRVTANVLNRFLDVSSDAAAPQAARRPNPNKEARR